MQWWHATTKFATISLIVVSLVITPQYWVIADVARTPVGVAIDEAGVYNAVSHDLQDKDPDFIAHCSEEKLSHRLAESGFIRNPFSKVEVINDSTDVGSWMYRESTMATYQTHVRTHVRNDGTVAIYVHREWSYIRHPVKHLRNPGEPNTTPTAEQHFTHLLRTHPSTYFSVDRVRSIAAPDVQCRIEPV